MSATETPAAVFTAGAAARVAERLGIRITRAPFGSEAWESWAERLLWASVCPEDQLAAAVAEANRYAAR